MPDDIVARAKAALDGVTYGPWEIDERYPIIWLGDFCPGFRIESHDKAEENATFVIESRSLVPELVAEIEALRATVARLTTNPFGSTADSTTRLAKRF
ncbi:MAG: hypothetical protein KDJ29_21560 [Hyphomicrobiales bacterium]|uniref:hypothetical protein n=1 Tax=Mycobacteriaceae TaxID=1762 RepID=UPI001F153F28|nr:MULTISPECIES: hypothetical protein [Mycobacteriaceae]MCC2099491.1 hypothetical protein [Hyphomicrobiales bacterium]MCG7597452.1 hypothetical protein [Mycobacterium sp. PSTR-4-N]MDW5610452.1 hypothetical protein [Mycolicibacterium sp. D5.8-2]